MGTYTFLFVLKKSGVLLDIIGYFVYLPIKKRHVGEIKNTVRILRFILIGTLNALITALVVWLMMDKLNCNYIVANVAAYVIAQTHNFFWSKYWIFTSRNGKFHREIPLFLIAFACAYGSQFLALLIMVEALGLNEYLAQFLGLFVYGAVNFLMNKRVTFKK